MNVEDQLKYSLPFISQQKSSSSQQINDYYELLQIENDSSLFDKLKSFNIEKLLDITNQEQPQPEQQIHIQLNNQYSLRNITQNDVNNVMESWSYVRHDLDTFSLMLLRTLCEVCPETMTKLKMAQGVPVLTGQGELVIYTKETLEEARKLIHFLDKILMNLDKPEKVHLLLCRIAGPYGFIETMLAMKDIKDLVFTTLHAIEEYIPKRSTEETHKSFIKVLCIVYSLIQNLTKWNDRSDIFKPTNKNI